MSLHGPTGACIPVASASPIDVPPIQRVLKALWCIHTYIYIPRVHEKEHVTEWVKKHGKNCEESYK